jgi:hypothetical protein
MNDEEIRLLKEKIQDHDKRIIELENILKEKKEIPCTEEKSSIKKIASKLGITEDKIYEIFDKEETSLTVIKTIGTNDRDKTQNIALLTLYGYKIFFGNEELLSQEIRRNVAENNVLLNNFATYLNELTPTFLRKKGEIRSPKTTYRLTISGAVKAKELIKNIVDLTNEV